MENAPSSFEGWAIVEMFGHAKAIGFVTTQAFGQAVLFRVDTPELSEREFTLKRPASTRNADGLSHWTPAGAKVRREAAPASSRLVGPGAIYSIVPCTEETAREAIEQLIERPLILLEPPKIQPRQLLPGETEGPDDRCCEECGHTPEEGHSEMCSFAEMNDEDEG